MIKNKKGAILGIAKIFLIIVLIIVGIIIIQNFKQEKTSSIKDIEYERFGDIANEKWEGNWDALNFFNYIAGGVPQFLINEVGSISASIVILALFVMFCFTFGDILSNFGMFSETTAWVIGVSLSIVVANLKVIMYVAVWSFGIIAGVGAFSVMVGIIVPFIIFLVLNIFLAQTLGEWSTKKKIKKKAQAVKKGAGAVESAIKAFRKASNAFGGKNP